MAAEPRGGGKEQPRVRFLLPRLLQNDIFNVLMAEGRGGVFSKTPEAGRGGGVRVGSFPRSKIKAKNSTL